MPPLVRNSSSQLIGKVRPVPTDLAETRSPHDRRHWPPMAPVNSARGLIPLLMSVLVSAAVVGGASAQEPPSFSGAWTATVGESRTLRGRWIGQMIPGEPSAAHGSWTLKNAAGKTAMSGTWSARKSPRGWHGTWSAQVEKGRAAAGTWKADLAPDPKATLQTLLELVAGEEIAGSWRSGRLQGFWWLTGKPSITLH